MKIDNGQIMLYRRDLQQVEPVDNGQTCFPDTRKQPRTFKLRSGMNRLSLYRQVPFSCFDLLDQLP